VFYRVAVTYIYTLKTMKINYEIYVHNMHILEIEPMSYQKWLSYIARNYLKK